MLQYTHRPIPADTGNHATNGRHFMSNANVKAAVKTATIAFNADTVDLLATSMVQDDLAISHQDTAFRSLERALKRELRKIYPEETKGAALKLEYLDENGDLYASMRKSVTEYMLTAAFHYLDRTIIRGQSDTWDNTESCGLIAYMGSKEWANNKETVKIPFLQAKKKALHTKRTLKNAAYIKRSQKRDQFFRWLEDKKPDTEKETTEKSVELKIAETMMRFYRQYKMDKLPHNKRTDEIAKWLKQGFDMMGANCQAAKTYYDSEMDKIAKK